MKKNTKHTIKRFIRLIGIIFLLLIVLLLINTFRLRSRQVDVKAIDNIKINHQAINHLSEAIKYRTISYDDPELFDSMAFKGLASFLDSTYPSLSQSLQKEVINNYSLLYTWKGSKPNKAPIVLVAHMDVVPIEESSRDEWVKPPFSGELDETFVWGRGTMDDKLGVIGILEAVEMLLNQGFVPERTIYLAFGHDEEIGGFMGAQQLAEHLNEKNIRAEFVLDEGLVITRNLVPGIEKDVALIGLSEKGYLTLKLSLEHEGGHASMPQPETTLDILARALVKISESQAPTYISEPVERFIEYIGPEMPFIQKIFFANTWLFEGIILGIYESTPAGNSMVRTTTAPTMFHGGIKENILPTQAVSTINFRILPGESQEEVIERIRNTINDGRIKITALPGGTDPSPVSSTSGFGFQTIEKSIRQTFPDALVAASLVNAMTDSRHYTLISDDVYRFSPQVATSDDLARFHGINERISIEGFEDCIRFYVQVIKNSNE